MTISTFTSFQNMNLQEVTFIAGTYKELNFDIYDEDGTPVDISGFTYTWYLSPYGEPTVVTLTKTGSFRSEVTNKNRFSVYIYTGETSLLSGKYLQQPVIITSPGSEFRPAQGVINILPAIGA